MNKEKHFTPQYPPTLSEQITEFLTNSIVEGRLGHGQRLVENELQRRFKISRGPIREAFRVLEKNGLILIIPRKGTFIRKISQKDIEEVFPILANLESLAAGMAAPNITVEDIAAMESALSMMTKAANEKNLRSYLKYHLNYHKVFIDASRNEALIKIIETLRRQAIWFRFSYAKFLESPEYATAVHREILDLFVRKEASGVENLVKDHILVALRDFIRVFDSMNQGGEREE